ncbi:MAG: hypothetical protein RDV48_23735 [Candidatus Eremiobacteraeota bacterium]|nr:hypothetical protein [Candidatus Eremiobacteraeota bacterium]
MKERKAGPLKDPKIIDGIGKRKEGGIDLFILAAGKLEAEHQSLLLEKVECYLKAINSEKFRNDFKNPSPARTHIVIKCAMAPDEVMTRFVRAMKKYVRDNNARLRLEVVEVQ